jgi:hypothetical protein
MKKVLSKLGRKINTGKPAGIRTPRYGKSSVTLMKKVIKQKLKK